MNARLAGLAAALTLAVGAPGAAEAMTFLNAGDTGTFQVFGFDKDAGQNGQFVNSLSADLAFTLVSKSADKKTWNFTYSADNTSTDQIARLVSFALSVDPDFKASGGITGTSGAFTATKVTKLENYSAELCFVAGNNCNGGGNGGITSSVAKSIGNFTLKFANSQQAAVNFTGAYAKFQSTQYNRGGSLSAKECTAGMYCGGGGGAVPEPATWAMMIMGFGAIGAVIRRRRTVYA